MIDVNGRQINETYCLFEHWAVEFAQYSHTCAGSSYLVPVSFTKSKGATAHENTDTYMYS